MTIQSLQSLTFDALANSNSLSSDGQNRLARRLEVGERWPLDRLVSLQERYPSRLSDAIADQLSDQNYVDSCVDLTKIESLYSTVQRLSSRTDLPQNIRDEILPLRTALTNNFDKFSSIDLVVMALDKNHTFNSQARETLNAKLNSGSLDPSVKVYVELNAPSFTDSDLTTFALNNQHPLHLLAKDVLATKLQNGSFKGTIYDAERLIPVLGNPARTYTVTNFGSFRDYDLKNFALDDQHPLNDCSKDVLNEKLKNNSFDASIHSAEALISVLGKPALDYAKANLSKFTDFDLQRFALDDQHPLHALTIEVLDKKLREESVDIFFAEQLTRVPKLRGRARPYVEKHFLKNFSNSDLKNFAINEQHPFNHLAKKALITKLRDNSFNAGIYAATWLIPVLGEPASTYVERNS